MIYHQYSPRIYLFSPIEEIFANTSTCQIFDKLCIDFLFCFDGSRDRGVYFLEKLFIFLSSWICLSGEEILGGGGGKSMKELAI